jgi:hypothetical protein
MYIKLFISIYDDNGIPDVPRVNIRWEDDFVKVKISSKQRDFRQQGLHSVL